MKRQRNKTVLVLKKFWHFIWVEDSLASWAANVILAFLLVRFAIYPLLSLALSTSYPVVAVISGSMEHHGMGFGEWWANNRGWYEQQGIDESILSGASFRNGFSKGDIIVLRGIAPEKVQISNVIVYSTDRYKYPIIHRVTKKWEEGGRTYFETKGDNNAVKDPEKVAEQQLLGRAVFKIPFLGWIKIIFTWMIGG